MKKTHRFDPVGFLVQLRGCATELLQERQHTLCRLVGLRQHRGSSLCEDLALRQGCGLLAVVSIHDGAA
jgi:hypothetical protein